MKAYLVGIDFGNGETAAYCTPNPRYWQGRVEKPKAEGPLKIRRDDDPGVMKQRTVIHVEGNDEYSLYGSGMVMLGLKGRINSMDDSTKRAYRAFVQAIYERIVENNSHLQDDFNGNSNFELCIASPTKWTRQEKEEYIAFFNDALEPYNRKVLWVINESDAAYFTHRDDRNNVLVIDFGSSTIDYTLMSHGRKVSDDSWSNELGAKGIEGAMKNAYALAEPKAGQTESEYQQMRNQIMALSRNGQYSYVDIEQTLELIFREEKERAYTAQRNRYSVKSSFGEITGDLQLEDIDVKHSGYFRNCQDKYGAQNGVCEDYIELVKEDFKDLKERVYEKLPTGEHLNKIILSGGACNMKWVGEIVKEIFSNVDTNIDEDDHKEYVVATGIARYAKAQKEAHDRYEERIKQMRFRDMYINADANAIAKSIKQLSPQMTDVLKQQPSATGIQVRSAFCQFVEDLNETNENYTELVQSEFNDIISKSVQDAIKSVILEVFAIEVDTSDIQLNVSVPIIPWNHELFEPGGNFYEAFTQWINAASKKWNFTWNLPRTGQDLVRIVDGTAQTLCSILESGPIANYPEEVLNKMETDIKEIVLKQADRIFYEKQLFQTTFKE